MDNLTQFEPTILKLAKTYQIPPLEWSDIAQELRIHLWENRHKFNPVKATYENWAYICCRNKIKDLAKYHKRQCRDGSKDTRLDDLYDENGECRI
jgi:RNA polymerase sigma factor (sigma-70 family)